MQMHFDAGEIPQCPQCYNLFIEIFHEDVSCMFGVCYKWFIYITLIYLYSQKFYISSYCSIKSSHHVHFFHLWPVYFPKPLETRNPVYGPVTPMDAPFIYHYLILVGNKTYILGYWTDTEIIPQGKHSPTVLHSVLLYIWNFVKRK